ncbi:DUF4062 domain-containing protein [Engelhardtia mirabilis]|uniref:DUF4062 domain-containing protein n=1 Tax=Engelhardtia mirabilis TaxID=2528011 RepID=A0A518BK15_9BACT|nr:hypothetical protein Pla133_23980 [Planctomycetes bacterium Pla133]QDV01643.1 hypothetical protein Pla86_23970 [Planctomycetes bacterium Pla86]
MTERPRVFVSSVMDGFGEYRAAARAGIEAAGCEPVLVEDNPSLDASPRNACLDGVESCDAVVVVVGDRGGYTAPSGKLVVEEEYEHAVGRSIPTLVFIQDGVERDEDADGLAARLSEYVDGRFRRSFNGPDDLAREVEAAVRTVAGARRSAGMDRQRMDGLLAEPPDFGHEVVLRVVVAPGRQDETVVPVEQLDGDDFRYDFVRIGTERGVGLFDQNAARESERGPGSLVVTQRGSGAPGQTVRVEMTEDGWLTIDANMTGADERSRRDPMAGFGLYPVEVEEIAARAAFALRFARGVYEHLDPHGRHAGLLVNASLGSLNGKLIAHRRDRERLKGQMGGMFGQRDGEVPVSFDRPERVSRADAGWVDDLAHRVAGRLERRVNTSDPARRF